MKSSSDVRSSEELDACLDEALEESFPASDPPSITQPGGGRREAVPSAEARLETDRRGLGLRPILLLVAAIGWVIGTLHWRAARTET